MNKNGFRICIITPPLNKSGIRPLSNLIEILSYYTPYLSIISGNEISNVKIPINVKDIISLNYNYSLTKIMKITQYLVLQLKISYYLGIHRNKYDMCFYFFGSHLLLPIMFSKILGKKVILQLGGNSSSSSTHSQSYYSKPLFILEKLGFTLTDQLIVYSPVIIKQWGLERYVNKISIANEHLIDFKTFHVIDKYSDRKNVIGYIGRFSEEKGVFNFIKSLKIINEFKNVDVLLIGDGNLKTKIEYYLNTNDLNCNVEIVEWVDHNILPIYLNKLRLLVLPSYTEGLPNIILEAIACGTPVLSTSVGAISDVIKDSETGFIMKNNSPECIANNLIRVLEFPNLEKIINNAKILLEQKYCAEETIKKYGFILEQLTYIKE